ncbi:MAG: hypothetical protein Q8L29_01615 [archaeon]|nr:hypothetical protein [archaeon]
MKNNRSLCSLVRNTTTAFALSTAVLTGCGRAYSPERHTTPTYEQIKDAALTEEQEKEIVELYLNPREYLLKKGKEGIEATRNYEKISNQKLPKTNNDVKYLIKSLENGDISNADKSVLNDAKERFPWIDLKNPSLADKYLIYIHGASEKINRYLKSNQ